MDLTKLFETQKILRDRIGYNEPDRFDKLILALLVEIGECANEWRGFKFWSKNQKPRELIYTNVGATSENAEYLCCNGCGKKIYRDDNRFDLLSELVECPSCDDYLDFFKKQNPLLEEYVDGLHFLLELGLELHAVDPWQPSYEENITEQFRTVYYHISMINEHNGYDEYEYAVSYFMGLGEMLGFTWDEIEEAYFAKNKINHKRQEEGY